MDNIGTISPKNTLEVAGAIAAFAKSLSDDYALVASAIMIAYRAVESDHLASLKQS